MILGWILASSWSIAAAAPLELAELQQTIRQYSEGAEYGLPTLSQRQLQRLQSGEVIKLLRAVSGGNFEVIGLSLVEESRAPLWIASQDPHYAGESTILEALVEQDGDRATWYGFLGLPRPFHDRHWVVENWNNHGLAARSNDVFWEHPWHIHPLGVQRARTTVARGAVDGVDPELFDAALEVSVNSGAWGLIAISDNLTLLTANSTFSLGGNIPERLVAEFMGRLLERHLVQLHQLARDEVRDHYRGSHPLLHGADGELIPVFE